jgi:GTPase SAR1 family protein
MLCVHSFAGDLVLVICRIPLSSTVNVFFFFALQDGNPGHGVFGWSLSHTAIKIILSRNLKSSDKSTHDADAYKSELCGAKICPSTLNLCKLLSSARVKAVAEHFRFVDCSPLLVLSLKDVKIALDVMQFVSSALQAAALHMLDVTNCALTDNAAEALSPLLASSRLTNLRVGGNAWSSKQLSLILQGCTRAESLGLEGLGDRCFQPESPCLPHISAMTNLQELQLDGFTDDCAEAVLWHCSAGMTSVSLRNATVTQLPPSLSKLTRLKSLHIDDCPEMYSLPVWLKDLTSLTELSHSGSCSIQYPPEQFLKSPQKLREFMRDAERDSKPWRRLKVVFLGNGRSGKTSLLRALAKLPLDSEEQSTRGVTVDSFADKLKPNIFDKLLDGNDFELSFWDFAGQLEYSASHDFFMSNKQAVYVIVFSATDDRESQQQQLLYWLSTVIRRSLQRLIRVMVVGTKTDLLYRMCAEQALSEAQLPTQISGGNAAALPAGVVSTATSKFEAALASMRIMVSNVLDEIGISSDIAFASRDSVILERGFSPVVASKEVLFATSNTNFCIQVAAADGRAVQTLDFVHIRRALKVCLYSTCSHIFQTGDPALNFPERFRKMSKRVNKLRKALRSEGKVPFCFLSDRLAVEHLGDGKNAYVLDGELMESLKVLDNLGILVMYQVGDMTCVCAEPQYLSSVMSLLADPQSAITPVTTVELLEAELIKEHDITLCTEKSSARELRELLASVGLVIVSKDAPNRLIIPLALRGRPVSWREVHQLQDARVWGRRLGSGTSRVSASAFMRLMTSKCRAQGGMMGCAFVYAVEDGGLVFVRLLEDRSKVDVVVVSSRGQDALAEVSCFVLE